MSVTLRDFESKVLGLSLEDRAILAEHLITSLDNVNNAECERLWVEEAEKRYQEYKKGNISSRPAEDVFRDAYLKLK